MSCNGPLGGLTIPLENEVRTHHNARVCFFFLLFLPHSQTLFVVFCCNRRKVGCQDHTRHWRQTSFERRTPKGRCGRNWRRGETGSERLRSATTKPKNARDVSETRKEATTTGSKGTTIKGDKTITPQQAPAYISKYTFDSNKL